MADSVPEISNPTAQSQSPMADTQPDITNPTAQHQDPAQNPVEPNGSIPADPLLGSGAFIDPERTESGAESPKVEQSEPPSEQPTEQPQNAAFEPGMVIDAKPISMVAPGEAATRAPAGIRTDPEEMAKRPNWLPEGWTMECKQRTSGATAGLIDRYYYEPSGKIRFRSKVEVMNYIQTGNKKKKPETDGTPSKSSASKKRKSSVSQTPESKKGKKASPGESSESVKQTESSANQSPDSQKQRKSRAKKSPGSKKKKKSSEKPQEPAETKTE